MNYEEIYDLANKNLNKLLEVKKEIALYCERHFYEIDDDIDYIKSILLEDYLMSLADGKKYTQESEEYNPLTLTKKLYAYTDEYEKTYQAEIKLYMKVTGETSYKATVEITHKISYDKNGKELINPDDNNVVYKSESKDFNTIIDCIEEIEEKINKDQL